MKTNCMANVFKKMTFPLVVLGALLIGTAARAQVGQADIVSISTPVDLMNTTSTEVGDKIEIKFSMFGEFGMTNANPGPYTLPQLEVAVNGVNGGRYAQMEAYAPSYYPSIVRTYFTFVYTVQPGDMASPLKIYANPGGSVAGDKYNIVNNGYTFYNKSNSTNLVWRFRDDQGLLYGEYFDLDFTAYAKRSIKTLTFVKGDSLYPDTVAASERITWRVSAGSAVPAGNSVSFYVWPVNTNLVRIVGTDPGSKALLCKINAGESTFNFQLDGVVTGVTEIALQRVADYNPLATVATNADLRTITVKEPPQPTVKVLVSGSNAVTLDESLSGNTGLLTVQLSKTYDQEITVQLNLSPTNQTSLTFLPSPYLVSVPANSLLAATEVPFSISDGTVTSLLSGILISPEVTNTAAASFFKNLSPARVYVRNVKPVINKPLTGSLPTAYSSVPLNTPFSYAWDVTDVEADKASLAVKWTFSNGGDPIVASGVGAIGAVSVILPELGVWNVTVTATDKDGAAAVDSVFQVTVVQPPPPPSVTVIPPLAPLVETSASTNTGTFYVQLSSAFSNDVIVALNVVQPTNVLNGSVILQTNQVVIKKNATNAVPVNFRPKDGTELSILNGFTVTPTIVSPLEARAKYSDVVTAEIKIQNVAPKLVKPSATQLPSNYDKVPMNTPYRLAWQATDASAEDGPGMKVEWSFDNGQTNITQTGFGLTGEVWVNFPSLGSWTATVKAIDKDFGESDPFVFTITVVPPPTTPTITIIPTDPVNETIDSNTAWFAVRLSEIYTGPVTVRFALTPPTNTVNGEIVLSKTQVVIPMGYLEPLAPNNQIWFTAKDGTALSRNPGFTVTPVVVETAASNKYEAVSGTLKVLNLAPSIINPLASTNAIDIAQDEAYPFAWNVTDVLPDLSTMTITWQFGDGQSLVTNAASGVVWHSYTTVGDKTVTFTAEDKDGGRAESQFKISLKATKSVNVTPVGPVHGGAYASAAGLGNGLIYSYDAVSRAIQQDVYFFKYGPLVVSADLLAVPYKTSADTQDYQLTNYLARVSGVPNVTAFGTPGGRSPYDSFFYVWVGADQGLTEESLIPIASPSTTVELPAAQNAAAGATTGTASVDIRQVQAVFSREYLASDNVGDINADGIPDLIAIRYGLPTLLGSDLASALAYNDDLDYLPGAATDGGGLIGGVANVWAAIGRPFTAFLEVRGYHEGLNSVQYGSDVYRSSDEQKVFDVFGSSAERPTDPTKVDTDGDNYPDGWEYFFWYNALVNGLTGSMYNPADVGQGKPIASKDIYTKFDPLVAATDGITKRDLDNDGLLDYEELATGTNPIDWDTDGDGMCDGWEVLRGLNPSDSKDGLNASANNTDADFMAFYYSNEFDLVPFDNAGVISYFVEDTVFGGYYYCYHYGFDTGPWALGRAIALPAGTPVHADVVTVPGGLLLLHNQVYQRLGFDPRTAWGPDRANSRPFTAVDEYLLMEYMSENRLNGAGATIGAGNNANKTAQWSNFSTHPKTPDTDAVIVGTAVTKTDTMPDGWELYVSSPAGFTDMTINPWNPDDATPLDSDGDRLVNMREFHGTDVSPLYAAAGLYGAGSPTVTIVRPAADAYWVNKFWPTDPWNIDSDGDLLDDYSEQAFQYGNAVNNKKPCIRGGGLNPNSMDTDIDALSDTWEYHFTGTNATSRVTGVKYIEDGMDGTHGPGNDLPLQMGVGDAFSYIDPYVTGSAALIRDMDFDHDGLENYQEYWVQALRHLRYDEVALPMNTAADPLDPSKFFTPITNQWDVAIGSYWYPFTQEYVLLPIGDQFTMDFASTNPWDPDTDGDGMDDYYELFHGLNPILGEVDLVARAWLLSAPAPFNALHNNWNLLAGIPKRDALPMNFMTYPWLAGLDVADPDVDGLMNLEEQLQADSAAPSCSNTDPSPIWLTDVSSTNSVTLKFYGPGPSAMFFWPANLTDDFKVFAFESNEGYDTDNDGVSDKSELLQTATTQSNPQDPDDPLRRQAMWFSGTNSAAQTKNAFQVNAWTFRSFTAELWARPENVRKDQVLLERPIIYPASDLSTTGNFVRVNFRIGIRADGRVYAMYQNAGGHDTHTGEMVALGRELISNEWVHVAARMDGLNSQFQLLVNGRVESTVASALVPANGVVNIITIPDSIHLITNEEYPNPEYQTIRPGVLVVGAANVNTNDADALPPWSEYRQFYQGYIDEVRVWDGVRSNDEILSDYTKRYTNADLLANRRAVRMSEYNGGSRVVGVLPQLPPELIYHYTFDNLFGADRASSVVIVPRGFNDTEASVNRPEGSVVAWWNDVTTKSTVYSDYGYTPWIENGVDHLPIFGGIMPTASGLAVRDADTVLDSVFWSHYSAGWYPTPPSAYGLDMYSFPNSNNPYGYWYKTALTLSFDSSVGLRVCSDLLPLGDAFAKQTVSLWDNRGASGVWAETGSDEDSNGLPDWWTTVVTNMYPGVTVGWNELFPNGGGMTYGERYMRDIGGEGMTEANSPTQGGWSLQTNVVDSITNVYWLADAGNTVIKQTADSDGDGMPDWWENLYNLKPNDATGENGERGDPDRDGLCNRAEYLISEQYKFRFVRPNKFRSFATQVESDYFQKIGSLYLGEMFSDHDFMEDAWESAYPFDVVSRYAYDSNKDSDEDGWSNWSESRFSSIRRAVSPELAMKAEAFNIMSFEFPVPVIQTTLRYNGNRANGNIVINAFTKPSMDGAPDATFTIPYGTGSAAALPATEAVGYWADRTFSGTLSPGSVMPGSVSLNLTDMWTGGTANHGFDNNGILYSGDLNGNYEQIGTVDYVTGSYTLDLSVFANSIIPLNGNNASNRNDYIDFEISYFQINYSVQLIDTWPKQIYLGKANTGFLYEGTNYFFAFMDINNGGTWDAGEPCGVSDGFGVDIGWDRNLLDIELKDVAPSYLRMTLNPPTRSEDVLGSGSAGTGTGTGTTTLGNETRVRVQRKYINGSAAVSQRFVLDKSILAPRAYIHDGDVLEMGTAGLDWGFTGDVAANVLSAVYQVYRGNDTVPLLTFTNNYDAVRAKAVGTYPSGSYVYSARPTFKWSMPQGYTAFTLEIRKGSSSGTLVYNSGTVMAPVRDASGNCVWAAPIYAGCRVPSTGQVFVPNAAYAWRVIAMNPKFNSAPTADAYWSDWKLLRLDVNKPVDAAGYGSIQTRIKYYGPATNFVNRVKVQAFGNRAFSGAPVCEYTLTNNASELGTLTVAGTTNVNAVLRGLASNSKQGTYYVRAFIDSNTNGVRDVWETWGYANYYGISDKPDDAYPIVVGNAIAGLVFDIRMEDADSDQDWYPDAWEYELNPFGDFLNLTGPSSASNTDSEVNPFLSVSNSLGRVGMSLFSASLSLMTSDADSDGLGDMVELVLGSKVGSVSSAGDGFTDGEKLSLGISPVNPVSFSVTGLSLNATQVKWNLNIVQKAASNSINLMNTTGSTTVSYELQYKPSLSASDWLTVKTGTIELDSASTGVTVDTDFGGVGEIDAAQGFFRVKLSPTL